MAIVQNTLIGKSKQSVGGTTFTSWKGRNVLKSKAVAVANPRTAAQVAQRTQFSGCVKFYSAFKNVLALAFVRMQGNITASNRFAKYNIKAFSNVDGTLDPLMADSVVMASGSLGDFSSGELTRVSGVLCSIDAIYVANPVVSLATDKIRGFVYNATKGTIAYHDLDVTGYSGSFGVNMTSDSGDDLYAWVFSYAVGSRLLGNSFYCPISTP